LNGSRVINTPEAYMNSSCKILSYIKMKTGGVPLPDTISFENMRVARPYIEDLGQNSIVKPICGSRGSGIMLMSEFKEFSGMSHPLICQRFVRALNQDMRLFVVGGEVVAGMTRSSSEAATNISRGGMPGKLHPTAELIELALKSSSSVGCDICGVDIAIGKNGEKYVLEVNSQPDFMALQTVADVNIAAHIVNYLYEEGKR
jgi:RimK family alpha-L-glutamate ligase